MPRLLLLHAAVGMGHLRAATALAGALERAPDVEAIVHDTLDHSAAAFRHFYAGLYLGIAGRVPSFWSSFYRHTDQPPLPWDVVDAARRWSTAAGVRGLTALVRRTNADAVVATHFLPLEVLAPLRLRGDAPPLYCVVTDYRAHQFWAIDGVDGYFVPTAQAAEQLAAAGVEPRRIRVTGIPIDPSIGTPVDTGRLRRTLDLRRDTPVVLLNGSGIVTQRVRAIAEELLARGMPGSLVITAGRNRRLLDALSGLRATPLTDLRVLGPQPILDPLIAASDVVIGKAGGLTVSEVLARGVPLVIPTPVPGQEQANAEHVVSGGAGLCCSSPAGVADAVFELLHAPERRARMSAAAASLGRPLAARHIAAGLLGDLHGSRHAYPVQRHSLALA